MNKNNLLYRIYDLYAAGFRNMEIGKTLWTIIIVKLIIIFAVLKLFFFPDFLSKHAPKGDKSGFVAGEMLDRQGTEANIVPQK